ncbi:MAG: 50S ribosomal protein L24 [Candidatus Omnitrophica bacterium]|jgi:large subunit ribosomal protein L24|nr:50S ribosomal protein L24 [Candidatus Omnitrophota bacterium]
MLKIKRGDTVQAIKGKDRGKKGKVINILGAQKRAIVEGINMVKKHKRRTQQDQQGGVVSVEMSIALSNLMMVCKHCSKAVRVGIKELKDGTKTRFCKSCKEAI